MAPYASKAGRGAVRALASGRGPDRQRGLALTGPQTRVLARLGYSAFGTGPVPSFTPRASIEEQRFANRGMPNGAMPVTSVSTLGA